MLQQNKGGKRLQKQGGASGDPLRPQDETELDALESAALDSENLDTDALDDEDEPDDPNALDDDLHLGEAPVIAAPSSGTSGSNRASRAAAARAEREQREAKAPVKTPDRSKKPGAASTPKKSSAYNNPMATRSAASRRAEREARRRTVTQVGDESPRTPIKTKLLDQDKINDLLHNPTRFVSEDELRGDYGYVLGDIRSMGILAAGLIVLMIVLAQVLPR